jgi:hypothetical protein
MLSLSLARRCALALCALTFLTPAAADAANPVFGFNDYSSLTGQISYDGAADLAAKAGATTTRLTIEWEWVERNPGSYNWGVFDGVYWAAIAKGQKPLIGITSSPRWAWEPGAQCAAGVDCKLPPARTKNAAWQNFVKLVTQRYNRAVAIEIGNEPNMRWAWESGVDPVRYTELLKLAYTAVKSVKPDMPVLGGAMAGIHADAPTSEATGIRTFLQAMYDNGAKGYMDAIAFHAYPQDVDLGISFKTLDLVKETRAANGDSVPLWITEYGVSQAGVTPFTQYEQANTVSRLTAAFRKDAEINGTIVHSLMDPATIDPLDIHDGYGSVTTGSQKKPVYCALATLNAVPGACTAPASGPIQTAHWEAQELLQAAGSAAIKAHQLKGAYLSVTAADLGIPALTGMGTAGPTADPSRIGVYPVKDGRDGLMLCNASKGVNSFCIYTFWRGAWTFGSVAGTTTAAAGAVANGASPRW